jgi:hypothetical protein
MICFVDIDAWAPALAEVLMPLAPSDIQSRIQAENPEYVEDARDLFLRLADRELVIDAMLTWVRSFAIPGVIPGS